MAEWVIHIMESLGYGGLTLLMILENIVPPIPSEIIMPAAGFAVSQGNLSFAGVVIAGTLGSVLGALPYYYLGRAAGGERLKHWADQYGKKLTISRQEIEKAERWFEQYGHKVVFFARLIPTARTLISVPAGMAEMNLLKFLIYTTLGTGLWTAALAYIGLLLESSYTAIKQYLQPVGIFVTVLLIAVTMLWLYKRKRAQSARHQPDSTDI